MANTCFPKHGEKAKNSPKIRLLIFFEKFYHHFLFLKNQTDGMLTDGMYDLWYADFLLKPHMWKIVILRLHHKMLSANQIAGFLNKQYHQY